MSRELSVVRGTGPGKGGHCGPWALGLQVRLTRLGVSVVIEGFFRNFDCWCESFLDRGSTAGCIEGATDFQGVFPKTYLEPEAYTVIVHAVDFLPSKLISRSTAKTLQRNVNVPVDGNARWAMSHGSRFRWFWRYLGTNIVPDSLPPPVAPPPASHFAPTLHQGLFCCLMNKLHL